jgi:murein DD-endopeptidase MepM/ murein hydrolase activator NlpD
VRRSAFRHGWRRTTSVALASMCAMTTTAAAASAASAAPRSDVPDGAGAGSMAAAGGASASPVPEIVAVTCAVGCVDLSAVQPGATLRLTGANLATATSVVFTGAAGPADDVAAKPEHVTGTSADVVVPAGVVDGPLVVQSGGMASAPSDDAIAVGVAATDLGVTGAPIAKVVANLRTSAVLDTHLSAHTVYFAGAKPATLTVTVKGPAPVALSVALVRVPDGTVVRRWTTPAVAPGGHQNVSWDGKVGKTVPDAASRYQFQVWTSATPTTAVAAQADAAPVVADTVELRPFAFPIAGKHTYGDGAARFGTGRSGHTHEGQDVFAACGTPIVAARGGTVRYSGFQAAAGNYLVIDGAGTGEDTAYMHLRDAPLPAQGDAVQTGEVIGYVGDTGDADGCHLHFELWTAPGWYTGGHPIDPLPALKSWDV